MTFAYFSSEKSRAPAASRTGYTFGKRPRDAEGEMKLSPWFGVDNPSVSHAADSSPYTGEPLGRCDATLTTQGRLLVGGIVEISHSCYNII